MIKKHFLEVENLSKIKTVTLHYYTTISSGVLPSNNSLPIKIEDIRIEVTLVPSF